MKEILLEKLETKTFVFTDEETHWLMANIGHEDPVIRDQITYSLLARGIYFNGFTLEQFNWLKNKTISEDLLFYQLDKQLPHTLMRSFTALLNGCIIQADGNPESTYYHFLNETERTYLFSSAIEYLKKETDKTGYHEAYGWVHGFAHGADNLVSVVTHDLFKQEMSQEVLASISFVLDHVEEPFKDLEERRIGHIIYAGLAKGTLSQETVCEWIQTFDFPLVENADFYRLAMFENMLAYIYFHTLGTVSLESKLEEILLKYLKEY